MVPTVLQWSQGGQSVYVTGSFNAWGERIPLRRSGNDCVVCLNLLPGTYQYKFIVDNEWRFAADQPTVRDEMGNINNCMTVEDQTSFMREEQPSGFFDNNQNLYTQALPDEITLAKEPPQAPSHLWCLPLNFPPLCEPHVASWTLLPPLGVTLTHLLAAAADRSTNTLSVTQRVRSKFVTMVFIKPARGSAADARLGPAPAGGQAAGGGFALPQLPSTAAAVAAQQQLQHQHQQPMDVGSRPASQTAFMEVG